MIIEIAIFQLWIFIYLALTFHCTNTKKLQQKEYEVQEQKNAIPENVFKMNTTLFLFLTIKQLNSGKNKSINTVDENNI
jgi:hypothetical protein